MTLPAWNDTFNSYYSAYSIREQNFTIPDCFNIYAPDNSDDFACRSVIAPDPGLGATRWTINERWITIGVYRDEGRSPTKKPADTNCTWTRASQVLTMVDPLPHDLQAGDAVDLFNVNISTLSGTPVLSVIDENTFTVATNGAGPLSGTSGAFARTQPVNFFEENIVFRLLPSFKLISVSAVQDLINSALPDPNPDRRMLYNVTTGQNVRTPRGKNRSINYDLPVAASAIPVADPSDRRFGQVFDEEGQPLKIEYAGTGQPAPVNNADSAKKNPQLGLNEEVDPSRVYLYDFYGIDVNDPSRSPFFSPTIISRDATVTSLTDNFKRQLSTGGTVIYLGTGYDEFGNVAVGVQTNNALIVRKAILPLSLDRFNRPVKSPIMRVLQ